MFHRKEALRGAPRRVSSAVAPTGRKYGACRLGAFLLLVAGLVHNHPFLANTDGDDSVVATTMEPKPLRAGLSSPDQISQRRLDRSSTDAAQPVVLSQNPIVTVKTSAQRSTVGAVQPLPPPLPVPNLSKAAVIVWNGLADMDRWVESIWQGNLLCRTIQKARNQTKPNLLKPVRLTYVNITFDCHELFTESVTGTGNYILALYMMRSTALLLSNVHVTLTCRDAMDERTRLVLPWLTGSFTTTSALTAKIARPRKTRSVTASPTNATTTPSSVQQMEPERLNTRIMTKSLARQARQAQEQQWKQACCAYWCTSIRPMRTMMQFELRRMAIALVGARSNNPSRAWQAEFQSRNVLTLPSLHLTSTSETSTTLRPSLTALDHEPLVPNVELDDAVIHFRCGDLLSTTLMSYGFMTFSGYTRHISSEARTIGILTQPFGTAHTNQTQGRKLDDNVVQKRRCQRLTMALVDYLQERHPHAHISIHNDRDETIAVTYARIIMANQSIGAMSTFSVFPIVASFGTGYFLRPGKSTTSAWLTPFTEDTSQMVLFEESKLLVGPQAKDMWDSKGEAAVLEWFRS